MDGITFVSVLIGVCTVTRWLFHLVDAVEHYTPKKGGRNA